MAYKMTDAQRKVLNEIATFGFAGGYIQGKVNQLIVLENNKMIEPRGVAKWAVTPTGCEFAGINVEAAIDEIHAQALIENAEWDANNAPTIAAETQTITQHAALTAIMSAGGVIIIENESENVTTSEAETSAAQTYLYATRSRPAMYGTVPAGFTLVSEDQTDLTPFGTISYPEPLDALTCWKYELRSMFEGYKVGDSVAWVEGGKVCTGKIYQIDDKWNIWADEYTKLPFWALHRIEVNAPSAGDIAVQVFEDLHFAEALKEGGDALTAKVAAVGMELQARGLSNAEALTAVLVPLAAREIEVQATPIAIPTSKTHPVIDALLKIDVDALGPIEALTKLMELKRMARAEAQ